MRIVGGIHASHPGGFLYQAFGHTERFWRYVFGEATIPAIPDERAIYRPRARSARDELDSNESGGLHLPETTPSEHVERAELRAKQFGVRSTRIPESSQERQALDEHYRSPQWPEDPTTFMSTREPQFYIERLTVGQVKIAAKESDLQRVGEPSWYRCGRMAGEYTMLNLPQEDTHPNFGNSIQDIYEENVAVNKMKAGSEPLYSDEEKSLVQYGLRVALECLTYNSPFIRRDLFRIDPRVQSRMQGRQSESHVAGWLLLCGVTESMRKGLMVPDDFAKCLLQLTAFNRIYSTSRSQEVAATLLGFNYPSSELNRSILTAVDFYRLMRQVQILPISYQELLIVRSFSAGRFSGMIAVGTRPQYARCSLEKEMFITREMFPSVPEGMSDAVPLNLEVLVASEHLKSSRLAQRLKAQNRAREQMEQELTEPDISFVHEDWEEAYSAHLTKSMQEAGLSDYQIRYLLVRYGEYFVSWREKYGDHPNFTNLRKLQQLVPLEGTDLHQVEPDNRNWLAKYQLRLPSSVDLQDTTHLRSMHYHFNNPAGQSNLTNAESETDSVFGHAPEESSTESASDVMNQAMLCESVSIESRSADSLCDPGSMPEQKLPRIGPSEFAHSDLSPADFQRLTDRILLNPLLTPSQYEDRFTNPALDKKDECQRCVITLPAYVQVRLSQHPTTEPQVPARSGFESTFLRVPSAGPEPSFRLMSYPRPTVVTHYAKQGESVNRHGKKIDIRTPVYSYTRKYFHEYLKHPKRVGDRFKFSRGTLHSIIAHHCLPTEDYGPTMSAEERHAYFTEEELKETSVYQGLRPAFGNPVQYPVVPGRVFSPQYDHAGRVSLLVHMQPMIEPTLIEPGTVRPRIGVCAHLDLHSLTPAESLSLFSAFLQNGYEVLKGYTRDDVRYLRSEWPSLPCFMSVISPGLIDKTTEKNDPDHKTRGYRLWQTKKGGQLIGAIVCGAAIRRPLCEGTAEMEAEHTKYHELLASRNLHYVWRYPEGTPGNYKVRDPERPQPSLRNIWHKVKRRFQIDGQTVVEEYWESLVWEGFPGAEIFEENYRVDDLLTGSRQYISFPNDIERETYESMLSLCWLVECFLPTLKDRNVASCIDTYFGVSRFNPAATPVHSLYFLSSLQASHGPLSEVMAAVEEVYGRVHKRDHSLYLRSSSLEKSPALDLYFSKIARFRNIDALGNEENFYHVNERGIVVEVKEEYGLHDGFGTLQVPPADCEKGTDYSWFYGSATPGSSSNRQRVCGGIEFSNTGYF